MTPARPRGRAPTGAPAATSPEPAAATAPAPAAPRQLERALETQRRRIAADLHDRSGPNLATIAMNLSLIERRLAGVLEPDLVSLLAQTRGLLGETVAELRDLSAELVPVRLAYAGLFDALAERIDQFQRRSGLEVRWRADAGLAQPGALRLSDEQEAILYRTVQEALNNCAKHARAGRVDIELLDQAGRIVLYIADDGIGFDPLHLAADGRDPGLGLLLMRERVEQAGGRFELDSAPGQGTRIRVALSAEVEHP